MRPPDGLTTKHLLWNSSVKSLAAATEIRWDTNSEPNKEEAILCREVDRLFQRQEELEFPLSWFLTKSCDQSFGTIRWNTICDSLFPCPISFVPTAPLINLSNLKKIPSLSVSTHLLTLCDIAPRQHAPHCLSCFSLQENCSFVDYSHPHWDRMFASLPWHHISSSLWQGGGGAWLAHKGQEAQMLRRWVEFLHTTESLSCGFFCVS